MNWIKTSLQLPPKYQTVLGCVEDSSGNWSWFSVVYRPGHLFNGVPDEWYDENGTFGTETPDYWVEEPDYPH